MTDLFRIHPLITLAPGDLFDVLPSVDLPQGPTFASLPDAAEVGMPINSWAAWYTAAAELCLRLSSACVFVATDRRGGGRWNSKPTLLMKAASVVAGAHLCWHKVILRTSGIDLFRPGYSHMLAFGPRPGKTTADVIQPSPSLWHNGVPVDAARAGVRWLNEVAPDGPIVSVCAGRGTTLFAAAETGRPSVGVDNDPDFVETVSGELVKFTALDGSVLL